jgi:hypothetical protein
MLGKSVVIIGVNPRSQFWQKSKVRKQTAVYHH